MSKVRVSLSLSLDGFGAGPDQSLQDPIGRGGIAMHAWAFATRTFQHMHGQREGGSTGIDDEFAAADMVNVGAWILGRNMFGPVRGPWPDDAWKGWWGDDPPYHVPTFVLTHHPRAPLELLGGTTFHFVTDDIRAALQRARAVAGGKDVRIGGGVSTVRQFIEAGLVDEMHLVFSNVLLGRGECLFTGLDLPAHGFAVTRRVATDLAMHVVLTRS